MNLYCIQTMNGDQVFVIAKTMEDAVTIQSVGRPKRCELIASVENNLSQDRLVVLTYPK